MFSSCPPLTISQANILIDFDNRPRLADYGFPLRVDATLRTGVLGEKNDIFTFGAVVHQVGNRLLSAD